jgi:hypothetical protein
MAVAQRRRLLDSRAVAADAINAYLRQLQNLRNQVESTPELSLREPLLRMVRALASASGRGGLLIAPEADAEEVGQPDVFIKDGPRLLGFLETKPPGTDLGKWLRETKQGRRYKESLANWVATDYYRFLFFREGTRFASLELADPYDVPQLLEPAKESEVLDAFSRFFAYTAPVIRSPRKLGQELARRARLIRDGIHAALAKEPDDGELRGVFAFYRVNLMSDLDEEGFADTFAQTVAYGLFLARLRDEDGEFTLANAIRALPESVPFLRSAVRLLTEEGVLPHAVTTLLEDLIALLDNTKIDEIRADIAAGGLERDLVVYFYERFLEQYDAGERKRRGVYYTPPELVAYLVRAADTLLRTEFGLQDGLADESVTVLDPAAGTGTFLLGAAEKALATEAKKGTAAQRKLVRSHLLPDFYGFELLPAPYAIAHLKLSSFYAGRGYELAPGERVRVYLTNSLEPHEVEAGSQLSFLPMLRGIVEEAERAGHVKHEVPVLVILGNPPYERTSHNANEHSNALLEDFYDLEGDRLPDRNTGPLRDDYLRFLRWATWKLLEQPAAPGVGLLAFVTNRAYLERKLHRAVRHFLLRSFDDVYVFDLHGDQREWFADRVDEKVFKEVQAGIALTVFVKQPGREAGTGLARVRYRDAFGRRGEKYEACRTATIDDERWAELRPRSPLWLFVPYEVEPEYESWPSVATLFPTNVVGFQTHRDQLVVAFTAAELRERLDRFADGDVPDSEWELGGVTSTTDFDLKAARANLANEPATRLLAITYRGLERRWIAFDERLIDRPRTTVSPHLLERPDNLALVFATGSLADGPYVLVSRTPVPAAVLSWRTFGAAYFAPLWTREATGGWEPNLPDGLLEALSAHGIETDPRALLAYVYAILNAKEYRGRFADALRYDFARVPLTRDPDLFRAVATLGAELVSVHLLEHPDVELAGPAMDGDDRAPIESPRYDEDEATLRLAQNLVARDITPGVWAYQQGAYRVVRDYLDARRGRPLSGEEFDEFRKLVAAVRLTLDILPAIDELIGRVADSALTREELALTEDT